MSYPNGIGVIGCTFGQRPPGMPINTQLNTNQMTILAIMWVESR
jgi:hypothetical protein